MLDVLVFGPHPDDAELGAGGAIIKAVNSGYKVGIIDLTAGEMGSYGNKESRLEEAKKAHEILGTKFRENLDLGDGQLSFTDSKKNTFLIADKIRQYTPKIVLCPYWNDRHPDHIVAAKIITNACHYAKLQKIKLEHSNHKIDQIIYYEINGQFNPSFIVDISDEFLKKKEAIMAYKTIFKEFTKEYLPFPLIERCKYYGSLINSEYGEAFLIKNPLGIKNWNIFLK